MASRGDREFGDTAVLYTTVSDRGVSESILFPFTILNPSDFCHSLSFAVIALSASKFGGTPDAVGGTGNE